MAEFTNQTVHSVYVNGQQIMTVADTTATTDDVEYGKLFHQANGQTVIGLGNRRAFIKTGDSSTKPEEIENLRAGDLYIVKEDVAENPKTLKVYVYINKINEDGSLEETGSWHNISDLGYSIELSEKIDALVSEDGDSSIRAIAQDEVNKVIDSAPEAFNTLKEIADWIGTSEGESAFEAGKRIVALENWKNDKDEGVEKRLGDLEKEIDDHDAIIGDGLVGEDDNITPTLTQAIIEIKKQLGSNNSEDSIIGRVSDLENWKDNEKFQYGGNTPTGINQAVQDALYDLNTARSAIRVIKKYSFGIEGGEIDGGFGEFSTSLQTQIEDLQNQTKNLAGEGRKTETVVGNTELIKMLQEQINNINSRISLLHNELGYAIFEPQDRYMDRVLPYGIHSINDIQGDSDKKSPSEDYPHYYYYYESFYLPDNWGMTIEGLSFEATIPKTTEFGIASYDGVSSYIDHQPLIKKSEQNNEYFKLNLNASGRYVIYAYCEDGYAQGGAPSPTPSTGAELSKAKVNIKYYIQ